MQYLMPKARNTTTGQTVKYQPLDDSRFTLGQRRLCEAESDRLATKMMQRSTDGWVGFVEVYSANDSK
jgi:hypothetical protein|tara:strand:- start:2735 stop:2938 length:204 start_codon:yes stop_codon:yes gene_type:complete